MRQILVLFCNLIALVLDQNNVRILRVNQIVKENKSKGPG